MSSSMTKTVRNSLRSWPPQGARAARSSGPSSAIPAAKSTLRSTRRRWRLSVVELEVMLGAGFNFAKPRAMTEAQIERAIAQFGFAARQVREAGFTGVTLHAAHGYLISQFLSPLTNRRPDKWGGSLA